MKYLKLTLYTTLIALLFSACGGGGGSSDDANFETTPEESTQIKIYLTNITCVTGTPSATDIENYETLYSNDTLVKAVDNTVISVYHDIDGLKKVCLVSGDAYILREVN